MNESVQFCGGQLFPDSCPHKDQIVPEDMSQRHNPGKGETDLDTGRYLMDLSFEFMGEGTRRSLLVTPINAPLAPFDLLMPGSQRLEPSWSDFRNERQQATQTLNSV